MMHPSQMTRECTQFQEVMHKYKILNKTCNCYFEGTISARNVHIMKHIFSEEVLERKKRKKNVCMVKHK